MTTKSSDNTAREVLVDSKNNKTYLKGTFLGKGGFAKCYEIKDCMTKETFAGKIVSKTSLVKPHQMEKMKQEIAIHRGLNHKYIVGFHGFFEDKDNVYIVLQLCKRKSLMELIKRRKTITEPEARYFMHQIASACDYLHSKNIIHRDLKLGNLFLDEQMLIKLGDFGLAAKLEFNGERKKTLCGTPNYLAPEVLKKAGHSFEVDVWSLGCILYTFLIGRPPFETANLKDTYKRIKENDYTIPPGMVSEPADALIVKLLQANPSLRPTMKVTILNSSHPVVCQSLRGLPLLGQMPMNPSMRLVPKERSVANQENDPQMNNNDKVTSNNFFLSQLKTQLKAVCSSKKFGTLAADTDDAEDPAAVPIFWVIRWVDYSDKYGLGYQLCDNSYGVLFNDFSRIILGSDNDMLQYIDKDGSEHFYTMESFPDALKKKITLLKFFTDYMSNNLTRAGENMAPREEIARLPFLDRWLRTDHEIALYLSNGTLQVNFLVSHFKIIMCPLMEAVTFLDGNGGSWTYKFSLIREHGCSARLAKCLGFALKVIKPLMALKA